MPASPSDSIFEPLILRLRYLAPLPEPDADAIRALPHRVKNVEERESLTRSGELQDCCCLLVTAYAYKHKLAIDGARQILSLNLPGEIVNTRAALSWETDFDCSVWRSGTIALIPTDALRELIFARAAVARCFWLSTHAEGAIHREWLLNVARRKLPARIAHLLCETSMRLRVTGASASARSIPLSIDQIAAAAGSVRLYTEQALWGLEEQGIIRLAEGSVDILDWDRLAEAGQFRPDYLVEHLHRSVKEARAANA